MGRRFTEGRRYSSWPERAVIMAVFCSALFFFEDINLAVDSSFGVESEVLTVILLIFMITHDSDYNFRVIRYLTGVR